MYRHRTHHWGSSKLAAMIRRWFGAPAKPSSATREEWAEWHNASKTHHIASWLTDDALDKVQDFFFWPADILNEVRYYVKNRFFDKMHYLHTRLEKGSYYDFDTRLMHGMFESLVDFVEIEKAHMQLISHDEDRRKLFRYRWWGFRWASFRSRELGMKYLEWEMTLDSPELGEDHICESQAESAREIMHLYTWWKLVRPARPDVYDVSGWSEYCKKRWSDKDAKDMVFGNRTDEEKSDTKVMLKKIEDLENQYDCEDEEMMIRLIKIRKSLWT